MRTFLLCLITLPYLVTAQNLTLDDIAYGVTHSVKETEQYLTGKGFKFNGSSNMPDSVASFSRRFETPNGTEDVIGYLVTKFDKRSKTVEILLTNKSRFEGLIQQAREIGYRLQLEPLKDKDLRNGDVYTDGYRKVTFYALDSGQDAYYNVTCVIETP